MAWAMAGVPDSKAQCVGLVWVVCLEHSEGQVSISDSEPGQALFMAGLLGGLYSHPHRGLG